MSYPPHIRTIDSSPPSAMIIPRHRAEPPPPLPPPQFLPEISTQNDPGWQFGNDPNASDYGRPASLKPGSSLLGGFHRADHRRNGSGASQGDGYDRGQHTGAELIDCRLHSERRLEHQAFQGASQAYDKSLLSRMGGPSTPRKLSMSGEYEAERRNSQQRLVPISEQPLGPDTMRLPSVSSTGAVSPRVHDHRRSSSSMQVDSEEVFAQDDFPMENVNDRSPSSSEDLVKAGAKRRASSPPYDRENEDHLSPRRPPHHGSISTTSSLRGSLVSSIGMASIASSATSYASGPPADIAYPVRPLAQSRPVPDETGGFMCVCCPKKPKKFDTAEDMRIHESEKQYSCSYCSNRFKNKNEAERHQNSLHLRRHSWSCAALTSPQAAFHTSSNGNAFDICGFCGQEFPNPADWVERAVHLTQAHKYRHCNLGKKFFRADHFRQHLKHSHDGTSGKWTNMLEGSCMKDEPLPVKVASDIQPIAQVVIASMDEAES